MHKLFKLALLVVASVCLFSIEAPAKAADPQIEDGISDLVDKMMPYMTPTTCTPENQKKMTAILDAAYQRDISIFRIWHLVLGRNEKLVKEGKAHYWYRMGGSINNTNIGVQYCTDGKPVPGGSPTLRFKVSADGKHVESDGFEK